MIGSHLHVLNTNNLYNGSLSPIKFNGAEEDISDRSYKLIRIHWTNTNALTKDKNGKPGAYKKTGSFVTRYLNGEQIHRVIT